MIQTIDQPESEENQNAPLTPEVMRAVLNDHFGVDATLQQQGGSGNSSLLFNLEFGRTLRDGSRPAADVLSEALRGLAGKCLAAANRIDEESGYTDDPGFYVRPAGCHHVAISGLDEDFDIAIFNADDDEDAIRQAREAYAYLTNGKPIRKPAKGGKIELEPLQGDFHFLVNREQFHNVSITVTNHDCEEEALAEASGFIEWLQAQASPESGLQTGLKIA